MNHQLFELEARLARPALARLAGICRRAFLFSFFPFLIHFFLSLSFWLKSSSERDTYLLLLLLVLCGLRADELATKCACLSEFLLLGCG